MNDLSVCFGREILAQQMKTIITACIAILFSAGLNAQQSHTIKTVLDNGKIMGANDVVVGRIKKNGTVLDGNKNVVGSITEDMRILDINNVELGHYTPEMNTFNRGNGDVIGIVKEGVVYDPKGTRKGEIAAGHQEWGAVYFFFIWGK